MKRFFLALGIAAVTFYAASAKAQPPRYEWSGFYIGGQGGGAFKGMVGLDLDANSFTGLDGWFGGAHAGYNWQSGNAIFGVNVNYNFANITGSKDIHGEIYSAKVRTFGTAEARIGGVFTPGVHFYGSGGIAFGSASGKVSFGGADFSDTQFMSGFTIGGGVDIMCGPNSSWFIQYKYIDLGRKTFTLDDPERVRFSFSTAMMGVSWRN